MVVMVMMAVAVRHHDDMGHVPAKAVMMMVVVMVMVLHQLHIFIG